MLIIFKSKASGDVIMFGDVGSQMLRIIGKQPEKQGIITVEQMPDAIEKLKRAVAEHKARHAGSGEEPKTEKTPDGGERQYVSIATRALPFIELLERSYKADKPVMWGV
jgi:hypothetical protein